VNVFLPGSNYGTVTNSYGFYSLSLPPGDYAIAISFIGYQRQLDSLNWQSQDLQRDYQLQVQTENLEEITVTGSASQTRQVQMSKVELSVADIKKIPMFMGEVNIIGAIQLLPGVQSSNEGTTGFYVRGGSPDQNLILLDGVPVYNASHLFGFFSVFNADAIKK
jgi:outer membrane cobalamin receptor